MGQSEGSSGRWALVMCVAAFAVGGLAGGWFRAPAEEHAKVPPAAERPGTAAEETAPADRAAPAWQGLLGVDGTDPVACTMVNVVPTPNVVGPDGAVYATVSVVSTPDAASTPGAAFEIELWAKSPERPAQSMLCLLDGKYGEVVKNGTVYNRNSHLDFNHFNAGSFTAGIQGGDEGQVVDLGDVAMLTKGVRRPLLDALRLRGDNVVAEEIYLTAKPGGRWQGLVAKLTPGPLPSNAPDKAAQVRAGHIYVVRIFDIRSTTPIAALVQVLEYDVGKRVRLRCRRL